MNRMGNKHLAYISLLTNLGLAYNNSNDYKTAIALYEESDNNIDLSIQTLFRYLNEKEKVDE